MTKCEAQIAQAVRLCPSQVEVTDALISGTTDCALLKQMMNSLNSIANQDCSCSCGYYTLAAVQAHENVHRDDIKKACDDGFATFKAAVEAMTVPRQDCSPANGTATLLASQQYLDAKLAMMKTIADGISASFAKDGPHGPMVQVEHSVVDPLIAEIASRMQTLNCP